MEKQNLRGLALARTLAALDGGRKIDQYLNISNPSEKAEEISRAELEAIIAAAVELHGSFANLG